MWRASPIVASQSWKTSLCVDPHSETVNVAAGVHGRTAREIIKRDDHADICALGLALLKRHGVRMHGGLTRALALVVVAMCTATCAAKTAKRLQLVGQDAALLSGGAPTGLANRDGLCTFVVGTAAVGPVVRAVGFHEVGVDKAAQS